MKRLLAVLLLTAIATTSYAQTYGEDEIITIWDNTTAPHSNNLTGEEYEKRPNRPTNVTTARLYIFAANEEKATGQAIVICPGGGYSVLAIDQEGYLMAEWFAEQGITAAVLKYRMPNHVKEVPIEDAVEAIRIMREKSEVYNFSPNKVGIAGASAGGHLAASASTIPTDTLKPNFTVLLYPVITSKKGKHSGTFNNLLQEEEKETLTEAYSLENRVTATTPPAFMAHCDDDTNVPAVNSTRYYTALKEHGIKASLHIYPSGGHGWGINDTFKYHNEWLASLADWLQVINE